MPNGYVRFWPKADIPILSADVRFCRRYWGNSGHGLLHCKCLLVTQSGHHSRIAKLQP
jgi:hypothetical protein